MPHAPPRRFDSDHVLYHANGLLVVDKPAGVAVHAGVGHDTGLIEAVKEWVTVHPGVLDVAPGAKLHPLNLIERDASGVVVIALSKKIARKVKTAIDTTESEFAAVVAGPLEPDPTEGIPGDAAEEASHPEIEIRGKIRTRVGGRFRRVEASLTYRVLRSDDRLSLVIARPHGHKAHQVRALFAMAGRPLAGDEEFGKPAPARKFREKFGVPTFLLHHLSYHLPAAILGQDLLFEAPWPAEFQRLVEAKGWEPLE